MLATELTAVFTKSRRINISEMLGNCYQICALFYIRVAYSLRVGYALSSQHNCPLEFQNCGMFRQC